MCVSGGVLGADEQEVGEQIIPPDYIPVADVPTCGDVNYDSCDVVLLGLPTHQQVYSQCLRTVSPLIV